MVDNVSGRDALDGPHLRHDGAGPASAGLSDRADDTETEG